MVFLGLSLPFTHCPSFISSAFLTGCSVGLLTCPNHLRRDSTIFSTMGTTPTLPYIFVPYFIQSRMTTHPSQHLYLCHT
ncbi:DNA replication licensing factor [Arachis hypogaea]|nr:DNA replication licensing factor [Arachis hypogaea]